MNYELSIMNYESGYLNTAYKKHIKNHFLVLSNIYCYQ